MRALLVASALLIASAAAHADVADLDAGLPTEIADAVTAEPGATELQFRLRWDRERGGGDALQVETAVQYGFAERWHAAIGTRGIAGNGDRVGSGDVTIEAMHRLNDESQRVPAFALLVQADLPTGYRTSGTDTRVELIATRTLAARPGLHQIHFNAMWVRNAAPAPDERADRGRFIVGYSVLLGEHTALIADVVRQHERERGGMSTVVEAGLRRAADWLRRDATLSFGIGRGWGADSAPRLRVTAGLEVPL
jgi:hypothetical protein